MRPRLSVIKSIALFLWVALLLVSMSSAYSGRHRRGTAAGLDLQIPKGIPESLWRKRIPANNPLMREKVALGRELYFDKRLSRNGTMSCATCHDPAMAFTDLQRLAIGHDGKIGVRNTPTLLNAMFSDSQFWDGRAVSLEEQVRQPLVNPAEMGMPSLDAVVRRIADSEEYRRKFGEVFGKDGINIDTITKAIAAFERTQLSGNSPFDRFMAGEARAITEAQRRGWELFRGKAQCIACHTFSSSSPFFTDFKFYNTGIASKDRNYNSLAQQAKESVARSSEREHALNLLIHTADFSELGRFLVTKQVRDMGAFKTPSLRDVELTAPYMHNGAENTLLDVVKFYNRGGEKNANLDSRIFPLKLTDAEMSDIVEFLRALTSDDVLRQVQNTRPQTR
jgi:cytochrome c peroxidase